MPFGGAIAAGAVAGVHLSLALVIAVGCVPWIGGLAWPGPGTRPGQTGSCLSANAEKADITGYSASFCLHQIEAAGGNVFSGQPRTMVARRSRAAKRCHLRSTAYESWP
jgi:hypothetical protein